MRVFKYPVAMVAEPTELEMPAEARVLAVGMQDGQVVFWAEVDPESPKVTRVFRIIGTGHEVPIGWDWRGTVQDPPFVWHVYEGR